ncbi:MAG: hypothetical protein E7180_02545 [Erysipelotrichaceae bacterium]|nr:hypothetical protein [Erysipelotrichaceae bacterium]
MVKKIIAGLLAVVVLVLAGFKIFSNRDTVPEKIMDVKNNLTSYHMEANMETLAHDDKRNFYVCIDYKKIMTRIYLEFPCLIKILIKSKLC